MTSSGLSRLPGCLRHVVIPAAALASLLASGGVPAAGTDVSPLLAASRYDSDYPNIPYASVARHNAFARLQERMDRGEVKLEYTPGRGYLDSLL